MGKFHSTEFKDVCTGYVEDVTNFLEAIRQAEAEGAPWVQDLGRVIPVEQTFHFTPETLVEQLKEAVTPYLGRISGGTFHVRLERRGLIGQVISPEVERSVAEHLFALAEKEGHKVTASFKNADCIVAAETVGHECGVTLLTRDLRQRYPFVKTR
ncbi:THUMP domain-containing protein [Sulfuricella sp.]|uniref:THUMP domain-containing protein n=1 Tax=Sulfuricella sp. TaxID=2099377 RepID=UPI002CAF51F1|nr:THUMP domain-containing protein [Sulfuricella sp.]HUX62924.1 THUMP domain-containing protein [Sulfuricella sp.]